jgi:S-adenosylmethionine decarboxylase
MSYWGYHLMLDCSGCNDNIKSRDQIYNFVKELIERIDMKAHGEPIIEYLLPGEDKAGYSLMQLITTSNICAHFVEPNSTAYLDVFSCKEFDTGLAENIFKKYFGPTKVRKIFVTRNAD